MTREHPERQRRLHFINTLLSSVINSPALWLTETGWVQFIGCQPQFPCSTWVSGLGEGDLEAPFAGVCCLYMYEWWYSQSSCLTSPEAPLQGLCASGLAELVHHIIGLLPLNLVLIRTNPSVFFISPYSSACLLSARLSLLAKCLVSLWGVLEP